MTNAMNVLEGLYRARAGIDPQSFDYLDYTACTSGHIYRGANGSAATEGTQVHGEPTGLYEAMLRAVVEANGLTVEEFDDDADPFFAPLPEAVSDATADLAVRSMAGEDKAARQRNAAVLLLSAAIEKLEGEQQAALGAVKARDQGPVVGGVGR